MRDYAQERALAPEFDLEAEWLRPFEQDHQDELDAEDRGQEGEGDRGQEDEDDRRDRLTIRVRILSLRSRNVYSVLKD